MLKLLKTVYHFSISLYYLASILYHKKLDIISSINVLEFPFDTNFNYLTCWNICIQTIYFITATYIDFYGLTNNSKLSQLHSIILTAIAFPLGAYVSSTFWAIYAFDRELVFPTLLDKLIPAWLNHVMHTNSPFLCLIEFFLAFHRFPNRPVGIGLIISVLACYGGWLHVVKFYTNVWVYPLFDAMNIVVKLMFYTVMGFWGLGMYLIGEKLNSLIWSKFRNVKSE